MDGDVFEGQRPARQRSRLEDRQLLDDHTITGHDRHAGRTDKRRVDPQRGLFILMIDLWKIVRVMRSVDGMMGFEMAMNEFGVTVVVRLPDVDVLGREQRHAQQADRGDERDRTSKGHCGDYRWRPRRPSILTKA